MNRIRPTTSACFAAIKAPALYRNFFIHAFVMFPAAMMMCWIATQIDAHLGIPPLGSPNIRLLLGIVGIAIGGTWVWYVYGYLFLAGGGSPGTHVDGGPIRLVDTGPYSTIRHPSVLGKMLGVIALGIAWGSTTFLLGFVPILIVYAVVSNKLIQERFCHIRFGAQYEQYCAKVPMLIPTSTSIQNWREGRAIIIQDLNQDVTAQPPSIWHEFRWYLLGLFLLIGAFCLIWKIL